MKINVDKSAEDVEIVFLIDNLASQKRDVDKKVIKNRKELHLASSTLYDIKLSLDGISREFYPLATFNRISRDTKDKIIKELGAGTSTVYSLNKNAKIWIYAEEEKARYTKLGDEVGLKVLKFAVELLISISIMESRISIEDRLVLTTNTDAEDMRLLIAEQSQSGDSDKSVHAKMIKKIVVFNSLLYFLFPEDAVPAMNKLISPCIRGIHNGEVEYIPRTKSNKSLFSRTTLPVFIIPDMVNMENNYISLVRDSSKADEEEMELIEEIYKWKNISPELRSPKMLYKILMETVDFLLSLAGDVTDGKLTEDDAKFRIFTSNIIYGFFIHCLPPKYTIRDISNTLYSKIKDITKSIHKEYNMFTVESSLLAGKAKNKLTYTIDREKLKKSMYGLEYLPPTSTKKPLGDEATTDLLVGLDPVDYSLHMKCMIRDYAVFKIKLVSTSTVKLSVDKVYDKLTKLVIPNTPETVHTLKNNSVGVCADCTTAYVRYQLDTFDIRSMMEFEFNIKESLHPANCNRPTGYIYLNMDRLSVSYVYDELYNHFKSVIRKTSLSHTESVMYKGSYRALNHMILDIDKICPHKHKEGYLYHIGRTDTVLKDVRYGVRR